VLFIGSGGLSHSPPSLVSGAPVRDWITGMAISASR
jgi:hypothetical protein